MLANPSALKAICVHSRLSQTIQYGGYGGEDFVWARGSGVFISPLHGLLTGVRYAWV